MKAHTFKRNKDFNFINNKSVSILSPLDRDSFALSPSGPSRETRNKETNSINKDTMPLDTPVKPEYDTERVLKSENDKRRNKSKDDNILSSTLSPSNIEYDTSTLLPSGANHNSPFLSFPCLTRESRKTAFRFADCGRSMVEMLGTLAVMCVLSIGGIMGYSYAVDKYHANQIMNDVNLRGINLIAQASRGGDFSLAEWPTKTSADYDIGLEVNAATNMTEGGIYVKDVEKRICEIIADDLLPEEVELVIDGESYVSGACGETNKMVFYYDAVAEALGKTCNGPTVDGVCQPCGDDKKWNASVGECLCADPNKFLNNGVISWEDNDACISCPCNATVSADGKSCVCPEGYKWQGDPYANNVCYDLDGNDHACPEGMMWDPIGTCKTCSDLGGTYVGCMEECRCSKGTMLTYPFGVAYCVSCPASATQYDENDQCICPSGNYPSADHEGTTYCR